MSAEGVPVDDFGRIVGSLIDAWEQMPNDLRDERLDRRMGDLVTYMEKRHAPALPASTADAREGALAKCVEALRDARTYVDDMATWTDDSDTSHYAADPTARALAKAVLDRLDAALALAAKSGGERA